MGPFLRRGGAPRRVAMRGRVVLVAAGAAAVLGALAVDLFALAATHNSAQANSDSSRSPAARVVPAASSVRPASAASVQPGGQQPAAASSLRQIILPDLLIVAPGGLSTAQIAQLGALAGVRNMITFDGAQISAGGVPVNVIGVDPMTFRSWVPLKTASSQPFWSDLAQGDFVAQDSSADSLRLISGGSYELDGSTAQVVKFGTSAPLGLTGVDLLVNENLSRKLGLVRQVAGLISAPGASITTLQAKVGQILGPSGHVEVLRSQQAPTATVTGNGVPTSYLQLFKASATEYCPGLSWSVLAAIGQIESGDGQNMGPSSAGALGPMQFLPSTWQEWGIDAFGQTGPPDIMNPYDAVPSAARMLCADGAAGGSTALYNAIFDYNHADWYVNEVLALAARYATEYA
jgi:Transglycosylase SLT domain